MSKTTSVDPNVPQGTEDPKLGDNRVRTLAAAIAELMEVDHYVGADGGADVGYSEDAAGEHRVITLRVESAPSVEASKGYVYAKDVNSKAELHFKDEDGNEIQLTTAGSVKKSVVEDSAFVPSGVMMAYGGAAAPTGWLLCNGAAVSRTTYADLFTAISTTYGVGNGSTTFNVPDLRGRVPVGLDVANANLAAADTLGETGGEETHALSGAETGAHTHKIADESGVGGPNDSVRFYATGIANDTHGAKSTDSGGSGTGHNTLQPYNTVNWIVKT